MLYKGKVVWEGAPLDFLESENPYVRQFVNASVTGPIFEDLLE